MTVYAIEMCRACGGGMTKTDGRWECTVGCHADIVLPGWSCTVCGVFNGAAKEPRDDCRACGAAK